MWDVDGDVARLSESLWCPVKMLCAGEQTKTFSYFLLSSYNNTFSHQLSGGVTSAIENALPPALVK